MKGFKDTTKTVYLAKDPNSRLRKARRA